MSLLKVYATPTANTKQLSGTLIKVKEHTFSTELETWLESKGPKTIGDLQKVFGSKSFAILFLILMFIPSLPIPTGGITHVVLLPVVMIAAVEMIFGVRTLWLPWFITRIELGDKSLKKALPFMMRRIRWLENFSRPRLAGQFDKIWFRSLTGLFIFSLALGAFVAPIFSGLDTLPSMGAVIISLAIILEDAVLYFMGIIVGLFGLSLVVAAFGAVITLFHRLVI